MSALDKYTDEQLLAMSDEEFNQLEALISQPGEDAPVKAFAQNAMNSFSKAGQAVGEFLGLEDPEANRKFYKKADAELETRFGKTNPNASAAGDLFGTSVAAVAGGAGLLKPGIGAAAKGISAGKDLLAGGAGTLKNVALNLFKGKATKAAPNAVKAAKAASKKMATPANAAKEFAGKSVDELLDIARAKAPEVFKKMAEKGHGPEQIIKTILSKKMATAANAAKAKEFAGKSAEELLDIAKAKSPEVFKKMAEKGHGPEQIIKTILMILL